MSAGPAWPRLRFSKMHGAGNDFVVLDRRGQAQPLSPQHAAWLADRHRGIGCDQVMSIEPARSAGAAFAYGIWNRDGSPAGQCGNGARCVAAWARRAGLVDAAPFVMDSPSGPVAACFVDDEVEIELGVPAFEPAQVPYAAAGDEGALLLEDGVVLRFAVVSMGNPHAVIEVADVDAAAVERIGAALQSDPRFPHACNVGFAEIRGRDRIRLRVYERGVGETLACGSGACAAVAVLARRGQVDARVAVELPGGVLSIHWAGGDAPMRMRGPAEFVFEGETGQ
jgi:diaminopimelate epimerase